MYSQIATFLKTRSLWPLHHIVNNTASKRHRSHSTTAFPRYSEHPLFSYMTSQILNYWIRHCAPILQYRVCDVMCLFFEVTSKGLIILMSTSAFILKMWSDGNVLEGAQFSSAWNETISVSPPSSIDNVTDLPRKHSDSITDCDWLFTISRRVLGVSNDVYSTPTSS